MRYQIVVRKMTDRLGMTPSTSLINIAMLIGSTPIALTNDCRGRDIVASLIMVDRRSLKGKYTVWISYYE